MIIGILLLILSIFIGVNAVHDMRGSLDTKYTSDKIQALPIFLIIKIIFMIISFVTGVSCIVG